MFVCILFFNHAMSSWGGGALEDIRNLRLRASLWAYAECLLTLLKTKNFRGNVDKQDQQQYLCVFLQ